MPVQKMKFVVVNNMAPRNPSVCAECSRPLERSHLHDLSTSKRYCGIECYPQWTSGSGLFGSIDPTTSFEFAIAWPKLTVDVAHALFDSAWGDHRG
jgi:Mg-chelatase subunit ChlI